MENHSFVRMTAELVVLAASFLAIAARTGATEPSRRAIKRSDVVFMGPKSEEDARRYGATVVSWGGRPWGNSEKAIATYRERVAASHALGIRHCGGAAFRTAFAHMIDFDPNFMDSVCRDLDGKPILVPWLWDHKHKGHPAYWFCTNAPGYRKYLKAQIAGICQANIDGLHIDDYAGTAGTEWLGGCFCPHCMRAFRDYLKEHLTDAQRREYGIRSLDNFDYGRFLRQRGVTKDDYRRRVNATIPLGKDYLLFQYKRSAAWVAECHHEAEQLVGHDLILSVNSSASNFKNLVIAPVLDYFCGEVPHGAERGGLLQLDPVWSFKLADALGLPQVATGSGQDWAYIDAHKKRGLVRCWIAQDYAFGHQLMAPVRQWAYTKEKGTHWYESDSTDYAHLYRFVRRHAQWFDGYEAVASVAVVSSNPAFRANKKGARDAALWLAEHNVPFHVLIAGDAWLDRRLTPELLARYAAIVVAEPTLLDEAQQKLLDQARALGKLVTWDDASRTIDTKSLARLIGAPITVRGAGNILAVPRAKRGDAHAPCVVHLLNREYRPDEDAVVPQTDVTITLRDSLFDTRQFSRATLISAPLEFDPAHPGVGAVETLPIRHTRDTWEVQIPALNLWALLVLEKDNP